MNAPTTIPPAECQQVADFRAHVAEARKVAQAAGYQCGNCGARFATKGDKRRHKLVCNGSRRPVEMRPEVEPEDGDELLYGRLHITPEIKARAAAEWAASDWRGRLPDGWNYEPALQAACREIVS